MYTYITVLDWATFPFYIAIIFIIAYIIRGYHKDESHYQWFFKGLTAKMIGGVGFAVIYVYYYAADGDTFVYYQSGVNISHLLFDDPGTYFKIMLNSVENLDVETLVAQRTIALQMSGEEELFTCKIISILNFFTADSYLNITVIISVITFIGSWKCFLSVRKHYPEFERYVAIAFLFFPTALFWGSGIMKDSIALSALLFFFHYFENFFWQNKRSVWRVILMIILALIVFKVKSYIFLAFIPALIIGLYIVLNKKMGSSFLRMIFTPFLVVMSVGVSYFLMTYTAEQSDKYALDKIESRSKGFQSWHQMLGGSSYTLGEIEYTPIGIVKKVPAALNVTFFRPYLWEVRNPVMLVSAFESTTLMVLFFYLVIYFRLRFFSMIFKDPIITISFVYCLILGFSVGFTSFNFGALVRYKVPIMPFFGLMLGYLWYYMKEEKRVKRELEHREIKVLK